MLTIRPAQLEVFQPVADASFLQEVVDYIRWEHDDAHVKLPHGSFTVEQLPERVLREMVRGGIERARSYGLTWQSSITAFVVLMFVVAPGFDKHPLISRVLSNKEMEPDLRLEELWEQTTEGNWQAARANYDASVWAVPAED